LNVQIARAYLTAGDPAFAQRTWQSVMEQMQTHGKESTKTRCARAMQSRAFDGLRRKKLMETTAEDLLTILNGGKVSVISMQSRLIRRRNSAGGSIRAFNPSRRMSVTAFISVRVASRNKTQSTGK
jgi:hypothetical protein